jgi:hypothetical protein
MAGLIIGSVVERNPKVQGVSVPSPSPSSPQTGFPLAQHRSKQKSAFLQARDARQIERKNEAPIVRTAGESSTSSHKDANEDDWRDRISLENTKRLESMTEEERQQEREEILGKFGPGVADTLRRAREARLARDSQETQPIVVTPTAHPLINPTMADKAPSRTMTPDRGAYMHDSPTLCELLHL